MYRLPFQPLIRRRGYSRKSKVTGGTCPHAPGFTARYSISLSYGHMPKVGIEPTLPFDLRFLRPASLPIPLLGRTNKRDQRGSNPLSSP